MLRASAVFGRYPSSILAFWALCMAGALLCGTDSEIRAESGRFGKGWKKHTVYRGASTLTAVAADFTGDGQTDIISSSLGKTRLFIAPDWNQRILEMPSDVNCIHSEVMDVDRDGDPDFIGTRYSPGLIFWLECPDDPLNQDWNYHLVDDKVNGIHGLLVGDVDKDGMPDLLATSAQPTEPFPNSLVWYRTPKNPRHAAGWHRYVFADGDAPGLSHYLGLGDVNGDGRPDAASAAKGGPSAELNTGEWFAWWEAPADPRKTWTKHLIAKNQPGATNIHPADVNGDGKMDFIASRGHGQGVLWFEAPNWTPHVIDDTPAGPHCLVVIDMDGDGDLDAATCSKDDRIVSWFENDGHGHFQTHKVGTDQAAYDIRALDLDSDGDIDLLIAGQESQNVVWYENPRQ